MESLQELRAQLDVIDDQIVKLFEERMAICEKVAEYKIASGKEVFDPQREAEKLEAVASKVSSEFNKEGIQELFKLLMSISRKLQHQKLMEAGAIDFEGNIITEVTK